MGYYVEGSINVYTGISSEDKPTAANGINPLNGSRWREVDTGKEYHYSIETDGWYETGSTPTVVTEGGIRKTMVEDVNNQVLADILKELKKMNLHLALMTDVDIRNTEVE